ncbi:MAG: ABC transporter substrate-binding protein [Bacillaceae bacterium]|nr:ABC transporter substrate-binding protein [Bacillaceae bacterium]
MFKGSFNLSKVSKTTISILLLLSLFLLLVGCGKQDSLADSGETEINETDQVNEVEENNETSEEEVQTSNFPMTIFDLTNRQVTFEEAPKRIVTVIPADMEIIYALGGEVVGRPQNSAGIFRPAETESIEDIGFPKGINFEKIAALQADMFIGHTRLNLDDVPTLESLGLNVVLTQGDSLEDIISLIKMYGDLLDRNAEAEALINDIESKISEILAVKRENPARVLVLFGTQDETMAALPQSLAGNLFELAGAENIARDLPRLDMYPTYAQLSLERILEANPDAIYFMAHGDAEVALQQFHTQMSQNPAWNNLDAVKNGNMIVLPHELFGTNPGPRIVDALQFLKDSLDSLEY